MKNSFSCTTARGLLKGSFWGVALVGAIVLGGCSLPEHRQASEAMAQEASSVPVPNDFVPIPPIQEDQKQANLAYSAADSLNPFEMTTSLNRQLIPLLYDSLVRLDKTWLPVPLLAREVEMKEQVCIVRWQEEARFTDGSYLTGKDIVYSILTARDSTGEWRTTLQNVLGCEVTEDGGAVEIYLSRPDGDFPALLTFPIVKDGTANGEYPVGISQYLVAGAHNTGFILKQNPIYFRPGGKIETVQLNHAPNKDAIQFQLKTGELDMVYSDMSEATLSNISASGAQVSLNHLVYLGVNGGKGILSRPEFRHALSLALNRDEIVATAYTGRARGTKAPFHPHFYRMGQVEISASRNLTEAGALLNGLGLTERDADGWRLQNGKPISLELLVNNENSFRSSAATLVAEQLEQVGIRVEVTSTSFEEYEQRLANRQYDLYLGETRLMDNMDFSPLLAGGALGYATAYSEELLERYDAYKSTGEGIKPLCEMFLAQSPFIPLVFREGMLFINRDFPSEVVATEQNLFYNILDW